MPRQSLRELGARPPLERMLHIHTALARGGHPNCAGLARELEVASKTIQRDLDFMRDRLGLPLEYVPSRFGYAYTRRVDSFPLMQVSEGDLLALFVAQKALGSHPDTPFKASLTATFRKLASALPSQLSVSWADLDSEFSYRAPGAARRVSREARPQAPGARGGAGIRRRGSTRPRERVPPGSSRRDRAGPAWRPPVADRGRRGEWWRGPPRWGPARTRTPRARTGRHPQHPPGRGRSVVWCLFRRPTGGELGTPRFATPSFRRLLNETPW